MKMPAAYAAGISSASRSGLLGRKPDLRVVVAFAERKEDRVVDPRRAEDRRQLSLVGEEGCVLHDLVDGRVVIAAPVGAREAEGAVEEIREGGTAVGRAEPVRDPAGLGDVPVPCLESVRRSEEHTSELQSLRHLV